MAEFAGTWDLIESKDARNFTKLALANMLQRITFHTGMLEDTLFDVFARTKCQIVIKPEELTPMPMNQGGIKNSFVGMWAKKSKTLQNRDPRDAANIDLYLMFDNNNPSPYSSVRNCDRSNGIAIGTRFRLGQEFHVTVPITGEKVSSKVTRISANNIVQWINFSNGPVELHYALSKDRVSMELHHLATSQVARLTFAKPSAKTKENDVTVANKKTSSIKRAKGLLRSADLSLLKST